MKCTAKSKYKGKHDQTFMKPRTEIRALPKKKKEVQGVLQVMFIMFML